MTQTILAGIDRERKAIDAMTSAAASGAASVTSKVVSGAGDAPELVTYRMFDPAVFADRLKESGVLGHASAAHSLTSQIPTILGKLNEKNSLSGQLLDMLKELNASQPTAANRAKAVEAVSGFFSRMEASLASLNKLGQDAETQIHSAVRQINADASKIFNLNAHLTGQNDSVENSARTAAEDATVGLAKNLGLQHNITNGKVLVRGDFGTRSNNVVGASDHLRLSYNSNSGTMSYTRFDHEGQRTQPDTQNILGSDGKLAIKCGGALGGLLDFKYNILPDAIAKLQKAASDVAEGLNAVHNKGTGWPPANLLTSARKVEASEALPSSSGSIQFVPLGADGRMITTNRSTFTIPTYKLQDFADVGALVKKVGREARCPTKAGAALGGGVDNQAGRYLIDQMALNIKDGVKAGAMEASLRLESGSDFDTKFRLKEVRLFDGVAASTVVPNIPTQWLDVKAGEVAHTPQFNMTLPGVAQQTLQIAMVAEVVGKDGTVAEHRVSYRLDAGAGNNVYNHSVTDYVQAEDSTAGGFAWPAGLMNARDNSAPYAQAKVAQSLSVGIVDDKLELGGRIAIVGDGKVAGRNFSHHFALNNLVNKSADVWKVADPIKADSKLLALGKATKQLVNQNQTTVQGTASATGRLTMTGLPNNNEIVTINGEEFTFVPAPTTSKEVQIGANAAATIANLVAKLNSASIPSLNDLMTFAVDPANNNIMVVTAKHMGSKANVITTTQAAANTTWNAGTLTGGADGPATVRDAKRFGYEIIDTNNYNGSAFLNAVTIDGTATTISAAFIAGAMRVQEAATDTEIQYNVAKKTDEVLATSFEGSRKLSKGAMMNLVAKHAQNSQMFAMLLAMQRRHDNAMLAAMAA